MTDRVPGAPGQYKAIVTTTELQKMQAGEEFTIKMTRDDQPQKEGTPYNKASVLPDDLAALICPNVEDPTPADAFRAVAAKKWIVTLDAAMWSGTEAPYTQTVPVDGVLTMDNPHYGVVYSEEHSVRLEEKNAFALVDELVTSDDAVTFICFEEKPVITLMIQMEVNR